MEYLVFPFGKYKGTKLTELPSTYIMLALEKFDLPIELQTKLKFTIFGRVKAFSFFDELSKNSTKKQFTEVMQDLKKEYQPNNVPF